MSRLVLGDKITDSNFQTFKEKEKTLLGTIGIIFIMVYNEGNQNQRKLVFLERSVLWH